MAKTLNPLARRSIARINATLPAGVNWHQKASCNAALLIAEHVLLGDGEKGTPEQRQQIMDALNDVVNPSALSQAMASLGKDDDCYRPRLAISSDYSPI